MDITSFAVGYQKGLNEGGSGSSVTVEPITITENGKKTAPSGRAYSPVTVNVQPDLETLTATENGTYTPTGDGYSQVTVDVQGAVVQPLSVTENGTYNPPSGVDGYAPVTVNVSGGGSGGEVLFYQSKGQSNGGGQYIVGEITIQKAGTYLLYGGGWLDTNGAIIKINDVAIEQISMGQYAYFVYSTPTLSQGDVVSYNVGGSGRLAATVIIAFLHD